MWVFGYGSLMWDGWEAQFGCTRKEQARLPAYRRDFNKASVRNWGSRTTPGPTLGLAASAEAECIGIAFEFPDEERDSVLEALRKREGSTFTLEEMQVYVGSGKVVTAVFAVNNRSKDTFIGNRTLEDRACLTRAASGSSGVCVDYVRRIHDKLREMGIEDQSVERFWELVSKE